MENYIKNVSGTSMGAFFSLAFALKIPIEELEKIVIKTINNKNITEIDNLSDEYSGLSYLNAPNCDTSINVKNVKKFSDYDYRSKYKTEKCKYWEINSTCKYGDSVKIYKYLLKKICQQV